MSYIIKNGHTGAQISSGQTRQQVLKALSQLGVNEKEIPPMPRHGRRVVYQSPVLALFLFIDHL